MKRCVLTVRGSPAKHGVAADSLQELREKAFKVLNVDPANEPVTLALLEDGTIVEDEDYFLCLPEDTEFLILQGNKKWARTSVDGGTSWMARESVEVDETDGSDSPRWKVLAAQLRENLSNIILLSEADFQSLIDVETKELSKEMATSLAKTEMLKDTLQRLLDRREEERQCKDLLHLYLEAMKKDDVDGPQCSGEGSENQLLSSNNKKKETSCKIQLPSHVLRILKEKKLPHLSLSNEQLEAVCAQDPGALSADLTCSLQDAQQMQTMCHEQLQLRYEQVQCMDSMASISTNKRKHQP
ncbi:PREDICTED: DNA fragmentation factor subunit alpha [Nanorana parkeri]|uniref:DNA fragmentation factor subunit alpha n=1 Tax=Nanorana parkeri TaxID=125878 RepID=UPI000854ECBD|nr:PREDICTED: DNA fragmentation factor subunit alpha [Nanorana parkeri]